jgi:hypothetical protein
MKVDLKEHTAAMQKVVKAMEEFNEGLKRYQLQLEIEKKRLRCDNRWLWFWRAYYWVRWKRF